MGEGIEKAAQEVAAELKAAQEAIEKATQQQTITQRRAFQVQKKRKIIEDDSSILAEKLANAKKTIKRLEQSNKDLKNNVTLLKFKIENLLLRPRSRSRSRSPSRSRHHRDRSRSCRRTYSRSISKSRSPRRSSYATSYSTSYDRSKN